MGGRSNIVPDLDLDLSKRTVEAILEAHDSDLILAAHDLSEGGLAVALTEMCIGGGLGADINIRRISSPMEGESGKPLGRDVKLFSESNSRYLLEISLPQARKLEDCLSRHEVPYTKIGTVGDGSLKISDGDEVVVDIPVEDLDRTWRNGLSKLMGGS